MTHGEMNPCGEKHFVKGLFYIRNYILTPETKASFFWTDSVALASQHGDARQGAALWLGRTPLTLRTPLGLPCTAKHAALELRPGAGFPPSLPGLKGD